MPLSPRATYWLHVAMVLFTLLLSTVSWTTYFSPNVALAIMQGLLVVFGVLGFMVNGVSPPAPAAAVGKLIALIAVLAGCALLVAGTAQAQVRKGPPGLTGDPIVDIHNAVQGQQQQAVATKNAGTEDLVAKLGKLALPDFEFALALSKATGNVVSTPCWQAWVTLLTAQQKPLLADDGTTSLIEPDPHLATSVEKISELLDALRPDSKLSMGCAALAAAAGKDAATLIQGILGGGALGLFKLPVPIP